ncbi:MAG: Gfo/Idh/MocA family oxidoreductase [Lentisphaeria bacterium]|nr:Gfo/Idh/MocA family oxidoreductase [Lentisphaeria bacterium]
MAKKKIGFIDLFIDEWHANNYPGWLRESPLYDQFELAYAYEVKANPNGRNLVQWCKDFDMIPAASIEEVVEKSDCLFVLAPSNPEVHEQLAELPLKSGKPLYIDKPFAPSRAAAERIFALADAHNTPMFSSSALRFGDELIQARKDLAGKKPECVITCGGGGSLDEYAIHQLEMIVSVMGTGAVKLMRSHGILGDSIHIRYADGRQAVANYYPSFGFTISMGGDFPMVNQPTQSRTFNNLLDSIMTFFAGGPNPVDRAETIEIATLLEQSILAKDKDGIWIDL